MLKQISKLNFKKFEVMTLYRTCPTIYALNKWRKKPLIWRIYAPLLPAIVGSFTQIKKLNQ